MKSGVPEKESPMPRTAAFLSVLLWMTVTSASVTAVRGDESESQNVAELRQMFLKKRFRAMEVRADALMKEAPGNAKYVFARGFARVNREIFEDAMADFKKAEALGLPNRDTGMGAQRLDRNMETAAAGMKLLPVVERYPAGCTTGGVGPGQCIFLIRGNRSGKWFPAFMKMAPRLVETARAMWGMTPDRMNIYIFDDPAHGAKATTEIGPNYRVMIERATADGFGHHMNVIYYEKIGQPPAARNHTETRRDEIVAHEFAHAMDAYANDLFTRSGFPMWWVEGTAMAAQWHALRTDPGEIIAKWKRYAAKSEPTGRVVFADLNHDDDADDGRTTYYTGGLMISLLIEEKGPEILRKISDASREAKFNEILPDAAGISREELLRQAVSKARSGWKPSFR